MTVEAASPALIEKVRSVATDGSGQFRIVDLRPGAYTVTFSLAGFNTVKREGLELTGSFTATVNADMRVGALEETITVTGETPIVDVQSATRQRVMTQEVIEAVPTSRVPYTLAALIPGISARTGPGTGAVQDVGGSTGNSQSNTLVVHGSKPDSLRVSFNGVTLGTLETGRNAGAVNNSTAYQEVTVDYAANSAEMTTGGVRINLIPKEGGNTYAGEMFLGGQNDKMQATNYSDELRAAGLATPNKIKYSFDFNPGFGGPVKRDKLWFYSTIRYNAWADWAGIFEDANANNPNAWTYVADTRRPVSNDSYWFDGQVRLTWQINQKNKTAVTYEVQQGCQCPTGANATNTRQAVQSTRYPFKRMFYADWSSPLTNRVLLEVVATQQDERTTRPLEAPLIGVTEQSTGLNYRGRNATFNNLRSSNYYYRGAVSYITGSHAVKIGFNNGGGSRIARVYDNLPIGYRFNTGVPNQITLRGTPYTTTSNLDADLGIYAQDKWTIRRLTLGLGARLDYYKSSFPEQSIGPAPLTPLRNFVFPAQSGVDAWKDLTPKFAATYDVFGTGRTALKLSLNKYLAGQPLGGGEFGSAMHPANLIVQQTTRNWTDANRDFVPDCDLINPVANGECGAMANAAFGRQTLGATYDPETLNGWGKRNFNWEFSTSVQHQVLPRVSVDVGFFRRWYGNLLVVDNRSVAPGDYTTFDLVAPSDPRLPNGGGYPVTGLRDLNPNKVGQVDNLITFADNYGKATETWNGVDVGISARLANGLLVQGGFSSGKTTTDNCEVVAKVPEALFGGAILTSPIANVWVPSSACHQESPFLTQVKMLSTYTVPKIDVLLSATFQSINGEELLAIYNAPNAAIAPLIGRPLSGGAANQSLHLLEPGDMYGERLNQLDFRVAKILRFGRTKTNLNLDLYNALNGNTVLSQNNNFGAWQRPTSILQARVLKVSTQFNF